MSWSDVDARNGMAVMLMAAERAPVLTAPVNEQAAETARSCCAKTREATTNGLHGLWWVALNFFP